MLILELAEVVGCGCRGCCGCSGGWEVRVWRRVVDAEVVAVDVRVELVEGLEEGKGSGYSCR